MPSATLGTFRRRIQPACLAVLFAACLCGCSSTKGDLQMISVDQRHDFSQNFSRAYISHNPTGNTDIVLVHDGADARNDDPRKPITPDAYVMPRQLVHIRVFWTALNGRADHPAGTNASLRWCFLGDGAGPSAALEYGGCGLVIISDSGDSATINVRQAWMKPVAQRGNMVDPLGPSMLNGSVRAVNDPAQVKALLAEIKLATAPSADAQAAGPGSGEPQRLTVTP